MAQLVGFLVDCCRQELVRTVLLHQRLCFVAFVVVVVVVVVFFPVVLEVVVVLAVVVIVAVQYCLQQNRHKCLDHCQHSAAVVVVVYVLVEA